jgi:hypothetical protein
MGHLARTLLGIPPSAVTVSRRGFRVDDAAVADRLESIGRAFVTGYHAALETPRPAPLAGRLERLDAELRGFAYEGAAMGLALMDALTRPRRPRWRAFLDGPGEPHAYMVHVGAGWAMARLGPLLHGLRSRMDPLIGWLAYDGLGFHQAYFHWRRHGNGEPVPRSLAGYARRAFDQGLGRGLWFAQGADPARVSDTMARFAAERRSDLWSGVGLASAYAGGADRAALGRLRESAGEHAAWLAQGAAFAAQARRRAGNPAPHTSIACEVLCGLDDASAARVTGEELEPAASLRFDASAGSDYQAWRCRVRDRFAAEFAASSPVRVAASADGRAHERFAGSHEPVAGGRAAWPAP